MPIKGSEKVINMLNEILSAELTAISQYFVHSEMCADWGYDSLHKKIRKDSMDEMKHAEALIERILYLKGLPKVQKIGNVKVGKTVPKQFESDAALETEAIIRLNKAIALCRNNDDNGTRLLLEEILEAEEEHLSWIETQLDLIDKLGEANYLAQQLREED